MKFLSATGAAEAVPWVALSEGPGSLGGQKPGRIPNEYALFLPGEAEALQTPPQVKALGGGTADALHGGKPGTLERAVPVRL